MVPYCAAPMPDAVYLADDRIKRSNRAFGGRTPLERMRRRLTDLAAVAPILMRRAPRCCPCRRAMSIGRRRGGVTSRYLPIALIVRTLGYCKAPATTSCQSVMTA